MNGSVNGIMNPNTKGVRNRRFSILSVLVLLCGIALIAPGLVHAQDLEINDPDVEWTQIVGSNNWMGSYDYGNVAVGVSKTATFDLYSNGPSAVWVYLAGLDGTPDGNGYITPWTWDPVLGRVLGVYSLGPFSFDPYDDIWNNMPSEMPTGQHLFLDVLFTPTAFGDFSTYLYIACNDSVDEPGTQVFIHLEGTGVEASIPEPAVLLLLGFGLAGIAGCRLRFKR